MNDSRHATKVGVFVLLAIIVLGALLLVFSKGASLFTPSYVLRLRAENVGGLKARSAVLVSGVSVGSVTDTELSPDARGVTIHLRIQKRYRIHRDARFVVEQIGLLGDQYVVVYPTENKEPLLEDGDEVDCRPPFNLQEVAQSTVGFIQRVDEATKMLKETITRINTIFLTEQTMTNLTLAVADIRRAAGEAVQVVERLDALVETNSVPVSAAMTNLVAVSVRLNRLADDARDMLAENRPAVQATLKNLEETTRSARDLAGDLQAGKGTAGSLLKDEALRAKLAGAFDHLGIAASNIANYGLLFKPRKPPKTGPAPRAGYPAAFPGQR